MSIYKLREIEVVAASPAPIPLRSGAVPGPHLDAKRRKPGQLLDLP